MSGINAMLLGDSRAFRWFNNALIVLIPKWAEAAFDRQL